MTQLESRRSSPQSVPCVARARVVCALGIHIAAWPPDNFRTRFRDTLELVLGIQKYPAGTTQAVVNHGLSSNKCPIYYEHDRARSEAVSCEDPFSRIRDQVA